MNNWLSKYWRWFAVGLVLIALSVASSFLPFAQWIIMITGWVETLGPFGIVFFALIYAVATVLFVPGSLLTIAAGLIFGVLLGTLAAWSGAVLGASLAFFSMWPPNSKRIADKSLSANSASPRELKRE